MNARVRFCVVEQRLRWRGGGAGAVDSGSALATRARGPSMPPPPLAQPPPLHRAVPAACRRD